jgi:hypothetical protein
MRLRSAPRGQGLTVLAPLPLRKRATLWASPDWFGKVFLPFFGGLGRKSISRAELRLDGGFALARRPWVIDTKRGPCCFIDKSVIVTRIGLLTLACLALSLAGCADAFLVPPLSGLLDSVASADGPDGLISDTDTDDAPPANAPDGLISDADNDDAPPTNAPDGPVTDADSDDDAPGDSNAETGSDCNGNGVEDDLDIANGTSHDCNSDGVPDECDFTGRLDPPPIQCPPDMTVKCGDPVDPAATGEAVVNSPCDLDVTIGFVDSPGQASCSEDTVITRLWTAVDSSGNISSCEQVITVRCCP